MRLKLLCGLVVATLASAAHAGFIDERAAAMSPAAAASVAVVAPASTAAAPVAPGRGSVMGMLPVPGWAKPAPLASSMNGLSPGAPANFVAVGDAIFRLLPEGHPAVILDGPRDALSTFVTWAPGLSRAEVLDQVAANFGLNVNFMGTKPGLRLVISKVPAPTAPSAGAVATVVVASAPGASTVKAVPMHTFEVRLSDIRLSTSMTRWANDNGVRIRWDADKHVLISAPETFTAPSVLAAVGMVLATPGIRNSEYPLEACEYPNTPRLIRITRQGEQAKDCPAP